MQLRTVCKRSRAWALVRLFGEPLGLDVLDIPPEGLSSEVVEALALDRRLTRLAQLLGIEEVRPDLNTIRDAMQTIEGRPLVAHTPSLSVGLRDAPWSSVPASGQTASAGALTA